MPADSRAISSPVSTGRPAIYSTHVYARTDELTGAADSVQMSWSCSYECMWRIHGVPGREGGAPPARTSRLASSTLAASTSARLIGARSFAAAWHGGSRVPTSALPTHVWTKWNARGTSWLTSRVAWRSM